MLKPKRAAMARIRLLLLGIACGWPELVAAQEVPALKIAGVVKEVDVAIGTLTVRRKGASVDETFNLLKKDIEVSDPSGRKAQVTAIKPGQSVQFKVGVTGDIESITIQTSTFVATVADVDLHKRAIVLADNQKQSSLLAVDPAARILLADRPAHLREIKPGSLMRVNPSLDGKTALALTLVADPDGKLAPKLFPRIKPSRLPGNRWVGVLTEIHPAKREVHFLGPKTKGVSKSFIVAKDAEIKLVHGQVPMQDLTLDQLVQDASTTLLVSDRTQEATRILVKPPVVQATVKGLDADGGVLTAWIEGREKKFTLRRDLKVMDSSRVRRLPDIQLDSTVSLVMSLDRREVLGVDLRPSGAGKTP